MKAKGVLAIGTAAVSFAIVVGMSLADTPQCTGVERELPWMGCRKPSGARLLLHRAVGCLRVFRPSVTARRDDCGVLQAIVDGTCWAGDPERILLWWCLLRNYRLHFGQLPELRVGRTVWISYESWRR